MRATAALDSLKEELGPPSVVVYNASSLILGTKSLADLTPAEVEKHFSLTTVGGYAKGFLRNINHMRNFSLGSLPLNGQ